MARWLITENGPGDLDITRSGRAFLYGVGDEEEALGAIRRSPRYTVGDTIIFREADGYQRYVNPVR